MNHNKFIYKEKLGRGKARFETFNNFKNTFSSHIE